MKIRVLGAAAGGGFPQWNCNCRNCAGVRAGTVRARARTQSSIAVRGRDAAAWALVNVSPDITRGNPILNVLGHFCGVDRRRIDLEDNTFDIDGVSGVQWRALPVPGKPAPYSPNRESPVPGDNLALVITDKETGRTAVYAPGLGAMDDRVWQQMQSAACVMVDGTFWT